ncbi:glutathione S-transferase T3 [Pyrus ussuriensis x Pyrus communis]|uniref:Glutathione S-transferase T3 n=1 Tax=Pyrus ussuriensis x Pyrus communis TaxID=2448454 RepID=A0A5N5IB22_9ROSA|nr:glutathione S-transferase T3 [Pyrus ussuriensis x Pyrus communis]
MHVKYWRSIRGVLEINWYSTCQLLVQSKIIGATNAPLPQKVNLNHVWVLLRHQPKWLHVLESLKKNSTSKTPVEIEEDNIDTKKRPLGSKAAKRKIKEATKNDSTPISVQIQKLHEQKEKKKKMKRKWNFLRRKLSKMKETST